MRQITRYTTYTKFTGHWISARIPHVSDAPLQYDAIHARTLAHTKCLFLALQETLAHCRATASDHDARDLNIQVES